jgi:transcription antitermination factor NusB
MSTAQKTLTRMVACQALYTIFQDEDLDIKTSLDNTLETLKETFPKIKIRKAIAEKLVQTAIEENDSISFIMERYVERGNKLASLNPLLRAILTVAITEMLTSESAPRKMILNEYVNITSIFFSKKETGFVNAVIDKYIKDTSK